MKRGALDALRADLGVDALLLTDPCDVRWACGFTGSNGWLLVSPGGWEFLTDGRYALQAPIEVKDARVHVPGYDLTGFLAARAWLPPGSSVAFRADVMTVGALRTLESSLPQVRWMAVDRMLGPLRASKSPDEVSSIRAAQAITEEAFQSVLPLLRPGVTEREVAAELVALQLRGGAERMAFDPIVASGHRSALPHARPGHHVLREGDPVLLDFGCVVDGYASDMTRMVCIGRPPEGFEQVCAVIEEALATAFEAARTGIAASALDEAARNVIDAAGFGPAFSHSLGHGVGLEVHEWPSVSGRNEALLPDSCVVTLEPGIYLDGRFGVRIEDLVWLKPDGAENLTSLSRSVVYL